MTDARTDRSEPGPNGDEPGRPRDLLAFVALTLALSWAWWYGADWLLGGLSTITVLPGGFGPPVAALAVAAATGRLDELLGRLTRWRVDGRWYALAVLAPLGLLGVTVAIHVAAGGPLDASALGALLAYPVLLVLLALVGGGQEELGWRGYALPDLQARIGPLGASLAIGVVWAVWHYPLFALGLARNASGSFALYALLVVGLSVLFTWAYNGSGGSVPVLALFHGGINAGLGSVPVPADAVAEWGLRLDAAMVVAVGLAALAALAVGGRDLGRTARTDARTDDGGRRDRSAAVHD